MQKQGGKTGKKMHEFSVREYKKHIPVANLGFPINKK
jgi:hypothetical protein